MSTRDAPRRKIRVELGEAVCVNGTWSCAGKILGPPKLLPFIGYSDERGNRDEEEEPTMTLLLRVGHGESAEEARKDALKQLTHMYGTETSPPPAPSIRSKSDVSGGPTDEIPAIPRPPRTPEPPAPMIEGQGASPGFLRQLLAKIRG